MWSKSRGELILVGWVCVNSRVALVEWDVIMNGSQYLCCWLLQVKQLPTWLQTVEGFFYCMCSVRTPNNGRSSISKAVFLSLKSGFKKTWQWSRAYLLGLHCCRWGAVWTPCFILKYLSNMTKKMLLHFQIFGICLAQNLLSDIEAVRESW